MGILRFGPAQRFEVPVVEVLVAQRTLQLWIVLGHVGVALMALVDALLFGNALALQFTAAEVYGADFEFWLLYVHIVKLPIDVFLMYAFGRSRVSFGTVNLALGLVATLFVAVADTVTLVVLVIEIVTCTDEYCFREGTDGVGVAGIATLQFYVLLFTVVGSLVLRIAASIGITFLKQSIRVRNTAALDNVAANRNPMNPVSHLGVRTVTAVESELPLRSSATSSPEARYRPPHTRTAHEEVRFVAHDADGDVAAAGAADGNGDLFERYHNSPGNPTAPSGHELAVAALNDPRMHIEAVVHYARDNTVVVHGTRYAADDDDDDDDSADSADDGSAGTRSIKYV